MALVRCTCISTVAAGEDGPEVTVTVADPGCDYLPHRLLSEELIAER